MPPKSKKMPIKAQKAKASNNKILDSADDFQAAADIEESAGGKWRAGDKAKSCRAFLRALEIYDLGVKKHPRDFDLAYNRARLALELSEQPALVAKLPFSAQQFLELAVQLCQYALSLDGDNIDAIFNTGEAMLALVQHINATTPFKDLDKATLIQMIHKILELFDRCYTLQEQAYKEQSRAMAEAEGMTDSSNQDMNDPQRPTSGRRSSNVEEAEGSQEGETAVVESAVTPEAILDTAEETIDTLKLLASLDSASDLPRLRQMGEDLFNSKIAMWVRRLEDEDRAAAIDTFKPDKVVFLVDIDSAQYDASLITREAYLSSLQTFQNIDLVHSDKNVSSYADALVSYVSSILDSDHRLKALDESLLSHLETALNSAHEMYDRARAILGNSKNGTNKAAGPTLTLSTGPDRHNAAELAAVAEAKADAHLLRVRLYHRVEGLRRDNGQPVRHESLLAQEDTLQQAGREYLTARTGYTAVEDILAAEKVTLRAEVAAYVGARLSIGVNGGKSVGSCTGLGDGASRMMCIMSDEGLVDALE